MARHRIIINLGNMKTAALFLTDASIEQVKTVVQSGGILPNSTRDFNGETDVPYKALTTEISIPKVIAENCIIEIDEVETHEPVAMEVQHPEPAAKAEGLTIPMKVTTEA